MAPHALFCTAYSLETQCNICQILLVEVMAKHGGMAWESVSRFIFAGKECLLQTPK